MTKGEHKQLHIELHGSLDLLLSELLSDYFVHNSGKFVEEVITDSTELEVS